MSDIQFGRITFYSPTRKTGAIQTEDGKEKFFRAPDQLHQQLESQIQQRITEDWQAIDFFKEHRLDVLFKPGEQTTAGLDAQGDKGTDVEMVEDIEIL